MSTLKVNNLQVGQDATASNNFTLYQPAVPDGTLLLGIGNSGSVTSNILTFNDGSSRLKIGTVTGTTGLNVVGLDTNGYADVEITSVGTAGSSRLYFSDTAGKAGSIIYTHSDNSLNFATNGGATDAKILSDGTIRVGNNLYSGSYTGEKIVIAAEPIAGDSSTIVLGEEFNGSANPSISLFRRDGSTLYSAYGYRISNVVGRLDFSYASTALPGNHSFSPKVTFNNVGNVGIGTTNPQQKLSIYGNVQINNTGKALYLNAYPGIQDNTVSFEAIRADFTTGASILEISTKDTNNSLVRRFRITHEGKIGIGSNVTNPTDMVHIRNDQAGLPTILRVHNEDVASGSSSELRLSTANGHWRLSGNRDGYFTVTTADSNEAIRVVNNGNVGIGTTNPTTKLQVEGGVYINNGSINVSKNIIEGTDDWLASSYRMDNYKTFTNGAYQNYFRFTRSSSTADNNRVGVLGGMLHIVYINDRSNSVHTTGYNCYPIVVRGRSSDTMSGTVGTAIADIDVVIGSDVQVRFISATTTTIDLQIYIYNSDGGGSEQLCHAWLDVGLSATNSDRSIIPSRL